MDLHFKLAYNTTLQLVGRVITALSAASVTVIVARSFGVSGYGFYTVVFSYVALFYVFTDFGINSIFVKETSGETEKQKEFFPSLVGLRIVLSIVIIFIALAALAFTNHPSLVKIGIIVALTTLFGQSLSASALALFLSRINYFYSVVTDLFGASVTVILVYLSAVSFHSLILVVLAVVASSVVRVIVGFYLVRNELGFFKISFNYQLTGQLFLASIPIGLVAIFSQINASVDKQIVLLSSYPSFLHLNGEVAAGIYGLAYKVFEFGIVLPTFIMNVAYPIMIQKKKENLSALINYSKFIGASLIILGIIILIVGWVFAPFVINTLAGEKFSASIFTARILFLGLPLFFITPLSLWLAIALDKLNEVVFIYGFAAFVNLVANLVFVPRFGYNSAAFITLFSELIILSLTFGVLLLDKNIPFGFKNRNE